MTGWAELSAAALLGTERRTPDLAALAPALADVVARLDDGDAATRLLDAAALATAYRRAGVRPGGPELPDPTEVGAEPGRAVRPTAGDHLARILDDGRHGKELLVEWATAAAAGGWRPPPDLLPALLDAAARDGELAAAVLPALGARGRWLAAFRPDWAALLAARGVETDDPDAWEHGEQAARRGHLARLRRTDPAAAARLLAASWPRENGEDREWFAELISTAPVPADEDLLETALDDRRKSVRHFAAVALAQLPTSAYAGRMAQRARAAIRLERRMLRSALQVTPPADCDAAMVRDGISPKPPRGTGPQAYWLRRILGATPLEVWAPIGTPAQLLDLRVDGDWRDVLLAGWRDAALRRRDPAWAAALAGHGLAPDLLVPLVRALEPADRPRTLVVALGGREPLPASTVTALLSTCPAPWPAPLAAAALGRLPRPNGDAPDWSVRQLLTLLSLRLDPAQAATVAALADRLHPDSPWRPPLRQVLDTLTFRHRMLEELR
ncbi:MAG TPA: DUF5691 domain-containing protein [Mycobacteriales bacterium]|nr:DUF5691 domain-containing protein [Mycobacteriales bacterium]